MQNLIVILADGERCRFRLSTAGGVTRLSYHVGTNGLIRNASGKQPVLGPANAPVTTEYLQQTRLKHDVAVDVALGLFDPQPEHVALAIGLNAQRQIHATTRIKASGKADISMLRREGQC